MNRLKLWALAALVLAAGAANLVLVTRWLAGAEVAEADARLQAAAAQLDARSQLLAAQASALAEAAARAPAVLAALAEEADGNPAAAVSVAVAAAARGMAPEAARGLLVGAAGPEGAQLRLAGKEVESQDPPGGLFAEALRGQRREGYARVADAAWFVVATPAGRGGAVAVGLPVDSAWASALKAAGSVDATLSAGQERPVTTLPPADAARIVAAARAASTKPFDVGRLGAVATGLPALPPVPLLTAPLPSERALVVSLRGMRAGFAALSLSMAPRAAPIAAYQVVSAVVLLLLLLAGLLLGLLVTSEGGLTVPRELVAAADRITRGDFGARVPALAGSLGTVAAALNKAADAVQEGQARAAGTPAPDPFLPAAAPASERDPFALHVPAPPESASQVFTLPPAVPPPPATPPPPAPEPTGLDLFAPAEPPARPPPAPARLAPMNNSVSGATNLGTRPEDLLQAQQTPLPTPAATPPPAPAPAVPPPLPGAPEADPDEGHWSEVYQEFLRVRAICGEGVEGLPADKFQAKLRANRAALVQKHSCRTVRFQVYVKDGRAALKATPIR